MCHSVNDCSRPKSEGLEMMLVSEVLGNAGCHLDLGLCSLQICLMNYHPHLALHSPTGTNVYVSLFKSLCPKYVHNRSSHRPSTASAVQWIVTFCFALLVLAKRMSYILLKRTETATVPANDTMIMSKILTSCSYMITI